MVEIEPINVSKQDVALRQLNTAIRLWFADGDPVSIHTLLAASHEIIHRLYRNAGYKSLLFNSERIKPQFHGLWAKKIKEAPNFFKHIDRDGNDAAPLKFNPELNEVLMIILCSAVRKIGYEETAETAAITWWKLAHDPELFLQAARDSVPVDFIEDVKGMTKHKYFDAFQIIWERNKIAGGD
jgi:hypothetical protein